MLEKHCYHPIETGRSRDAVTAVADGGVDLAIVDTPVSHDGVIIEPFPHARASSGPSRRRASPRE
jgi:hypothetical protein